MMQSFLQAGEFLLAVSVPIVGVSRVVGATSVFSPVDFEAMRHLPGARDLWFGMFGTSLSLLMLPVNGAPQNFFIIPMQPGQLEL